MFDRQEDLERMIAELRRPVRIDPALDGRVMQRIATSLPHRDSGVVSALWRWLIEPRRVVLSPLAGLGIVAALLVLAVLPTLRRGAAPAAAAPSQFQFVVIAPRASRVALVGDFNDWDPTRTLMRPHGADGTTWTAVLSLSPGRYRYGFLIDGSHWMADRAAPRAADDEFGAPSSVVTVGGL
jgi:hypothetical protein